MDLVINWKKKKDRNLYSKAITTKKNKYKQIQFGFVLLLFPLFFLKFVFIFYFLKDVLVLTCWNQLQSLWMSGWPFQYHIKEQ